jgi:hypothetical protein
MRYIVMLGPREEDEHVGRNAIELEDGSLDWCDTAGVRHVAPPGSWKIETVGVEKKITSLDDRCQELEKALSKLEWVSSGHETVHGRRMWMCVACTMTWREHEAYSKTGAPPHSKGCWLAALLGRPRYLDNIPGQRIETPVKDGYCWRYPTQ